MTENFWCPGTIESLSDESTVLGRKKLGCGWVFVNYRDGEADWQLLRPNFFNILPCERGLNSHTVVITRPRLSLAL